MSFSETLIYKLEEVNKFSEEKRQTAEEFLNLLKGKTLHEDIYLKGLEKVA